MASTFAGRPQHTVMRALHPHLDPCQLREHHMLAIIDGMQMDLDQNRYENYAALPRYCWNVAGVVGMLSASVYGVTNPGPPAVAVFVPQAVAGAQDLLGRLRPAAP